MKFGKLNDINNVDFTLPKDNPKTTDLLNRLSSNDELPRVYVGCTGWSMKEWIGRVYPNGTKANQFLHHYGKQFNTIELNTTHYRIPTLSTIETWRQSVPKDFKFCPKVPQSISHRNDLGMKGEAINQFLTSVYELKENLGCCFMQMPPYFDISRLPMLERFLEKWSEEIPLAIEVRHETWFNNDTNFNQLFDLLESHNISTVITDVAGRRDVLHQRLTTDTAMIRFVGNDLHDTDYQRIDEWVQRLKIWFENGLKTVYFFPHEPDNLLAPEMSAYLVDRLNDSFESTVRGPKLIDNQIGRQISLF
jgi:uncharacterized protein YecE (DUF72 family)